MSNLAQKFGFIGSGHAGSRFVDTLLDISNNLYPSVAFNSAYADLRELNKISPNNRVHIQLPDGVDGAGKDPKLGHEAVIHNKKKIKDKIILEFKDIPMIYLVFSTGGGTGRGSAKELMKILDELKKPFGVIMIEPFRNEGYQPIVNSFTAYKEISEVYSELEYCKGITLLDNDKIGKLEDYKELSIRDFYTAANQLIAKSFHLFNLATTRKGIENFDSRDYIKCLNAKGFMTLGTLDFSRDEIQNKSIFVDKLNENIENHLFTDGLDLSTATHSALILFIPRAIINNLQRDVLTAPFDKMSEILGGATLYRGIYPIKGDKVQMYTLVSGMDYPRVKIKELGEFAQSLHSKAKEKVQNFKKTDDLFGGMDFSFDSDDNLDLDDGKKMNTLDDFDLDF